MTYNILDGGIGREAQILSILRDNLSDIILLQEVTNIEVVKAIAEELDMELFIAKGNSKRHLALLSRFPIAHQSSYHPFPLRHTLLKASVEYRPNKFIYLFGVHLQASHFFIAEWWRMWEITRILREIEKYHSKLCLVLGDFNSISPHDQVSLDKFPLRLRFVINLQGGHLFRHVINQMEKKGFADCFRAFHPAKSGYTVPTPIPHVRLDYIFVTLPYLKTLRSCYVVKSTSTVQVASDHYPLLGEFEL